MDAGCEATTAALTRLRAAALMTLCILSVALFCRCLSFKRNHFLSTYVTSMAPSVASSAAQSQPCSRSTKLPTPQPGLRQPQARGKGARAQEIYNPNPKKCKPKGPQESTRSSRSVTSETFCARAVSLQCEAHPASFHDRQQSFNRSQMVGTFELSSSMSSAEPRRRDLCA